MLSYIPTVLGMDPVGMACNLEFFLRRVDFRSWNVDSGQSTKSLEKANVFIFCVIKYYILREKPLVSLY
jgi:hypothetical protein